MNAVRSFHQQTRVILAMAALCLAVHSARGVTPGSVDTTFDPNATGGNGYVNVAAQQPDGKIVVGGSFNTIGGADRTNLARLNSDGTADITFTVGSGPSSDVGCLYVQTDGKILIGGKFTAYQGVPRISLARLNADGSLDTGFNAQLSGGFGYVCAIAEQPDGQILIAGSFSAVGVTARNNIARLNPDGSVDTSFDPGSGTDGLTTALALQTDGKVLIGGVFSHVNGTARSYMARLNSNGSLETIGTFNIGTGPNNPVNCLVVQPDGGILAGGNFTTFNGFVRSGVVRLASNGALDGSFNTGTGFTQSGSPPTIYGLALQADGKVLVCGQFNTVSSQSRNNLTRLTSNGSLDLVFNAGTGLNSDVYGVNLQADGGILTVGKFTTVNTSTTRNHIARLNDDGQTQLIFVFPFAMRQVQWQRSGAAPEVSQVTFDLSTDSGQTWTALGAGVRITGGWQFTTATLAPYGRIRARGFVNSGLGDGSAGIDEQTADYVFPPGVATGAATSITTTGATLNGKVNPNNASSTTSFDYGLDNTYGTNVVATPSPITGTTDVAVSAVITGLTPGTLYHFRVNGSNSGGNAHDSDRTFTTLTNAQAWRLQYFGSTSNTGNGADTANPSGDGIPNLIKFATHLDPTVPSPWPGSPVLNGSNIEFTYPRSDAAMTDGVTFTVEWSDTLQAGSWSNTGVTEQILSDDGTVQQVKALVPAGSNGGRFVHLKVTSSGP